jgi:hypothetical protein
MSAKKKRREYKANARTNTHMSFLLLVNVQATRSENKGNRVLFSIETHHIRQRKKEREKLFSSFLSNDF